MSYEKLANIIFKDIDKTPEYFINKYPKRTLPEGAEVTRYAPSPTGFQHIGGVFAALVAQRVAALSNGIFFLRIEDTDQKREVPGAILDTISTMNKYGIDFNEGQTSDHDYKGNYGPYKQSERKEIYQTFAKDLIRQGKAYPCFATPEELEELRNWQIEQKITPGYYGQYAKFRDLPVDQAIEKIEFGLPYIIRLKSSNSPERIHFTDLIKGETSFPANNQDVVIIKQDGLPTYHFAHVIDDALMHTTLVSRGEEWLSSLPIHLELFEKLQLPQPKYAHIPTIMKMDGKSKRKLSKRKDPESAVTYYDDEGYPVDCVIEYLLNLVNSNYETWREENKDKSYLDFPVALNKMSKSGALFDIIKLDDVSRDIISRMTKDQVYNLYLEWAKSHDLEMHNLALAKFEGLREFFNIDKDTPKPRKDFAKWIEVKPKIVYLFNEFFDEESDIELPKSVSLDQAKEIIAEYKKVYVHSHSSQEEWFNHLKDFAASIGYCSNKKEYKKDPEKYKGMIQDVAGAVRVALTHRINTPDLFVIMQILGESEVLSRFNRFINN
ncbi:MAG: glutamate--tRNA ligase [Candidatus Epulonipiscioides saccharophilum]|nr:MAG: glutamate--tRNA ligase [Epulopiscium sp. AS2M-Bin001]